MILAIIGLGFLGFMLGGPVGAIIGVVIAVCCAGKR